MSKKLEFKWQIAICGLVATVFVATFLTLFVLNAISVLAFVLAICAGLVATAVTIAILIFLHKKRLEAQKLKKQLEQEEWNYKMKRLYDVLGIDVQYNSDGTIKDLFQLLGIEPVFDENGKRILTPYELLKMNPIFDENGKERPLVFIIKNRVVKLAKGIVEAPILTYKPKQKTQGEPSADKNVTEGDKTKTDKPQQGQKTAKPAGKPKVTKKAKQAKKAQTHIIAKKSGKASKRKKVEFSIPKPIKLQGNASTKVNVIGAVASVVAGAVKGAVDVIKDVADDFKPMPKPTKTPPPLIRKPQSRAPQIEKPSYTNPGATPVKPNHSPGRVIFAIVQVKNPDSMANLQNMFEEEMER